MNAKLPVTDLAMQDAIFYTNLTLLLLLGFLISFIVYVAYRTIQNENKRKQYTPTMKQGDNVHYHTTMETETTKKDWCIKNVQILYTLFVYMKYKHYICITELVTNPTGVEL